MVVFVASLEIGTCLGREREGSILIGHSIHRSAPNRQASLHHDLIWKNVCKAEHITSSTGAARLTSTPRAFAFECTHLV